MAKREERGGDKRRGETILAAAERRLQVGAHLRGRAWDLDRQSPARVHPSGQDAGQRGAALGARHEGLHQARRAPRPSTEGVGAPGDHDHNDGRAGGDEGVEKLRLNTRKA